MHAWLPCPNLTLRSLTSSSWLETRWSSFWSPYTNSPMLEGSQVNDARQITASRYFHLPEVLQIEWWTGRQECIKMGTFINRSNWTASRSFVTSTSPSSEWNCAWHPDEPDGWLLDYLRESLFAGHSLVLGLFCSVKPFCCTRCAIFHTDFCFGITSSGSLVEVRRCPRFCGKVCGGVFCENFR